MQKFPLRSPPEKVGGLVHFGRMLDKIRLHARGELIFRHFYGLRRFSKGPFRGGSSESVMQPRGPQYLCGTIRRRRSIQKSNMYWVVSFSRSAD
jgi:hypothetical protein